MKNVNVKGLAVILLFTVMGIPFWTACRRQSTPSLFLFSLLRVVIKKGIEGGALVG